MSKVLFVLSSHSELGHTGRKTGYYIPETAHPYEVFAREGFEVDFVSPQGGEPPQDGIDRADPIQAAFLDDAVITQRLKSTLRPEEVDPGEYDAVLFVGGHGTMWDFPDNTTLASIAARVYENGGVVSAVCHGPAGLVNVKLADGTLLVAGKTVAGFSDDEERAVGLADEVPFLLASKLVERGAKHTQADNFQRHVEVDGRLITGQNPASATPLAEQVAKQIKAAKLVGTSV